jgi:hypothetical protein
MCVVSRLLWHYRTVFQKTDCNLLQRPKINTTERATTAMCLESVLGEPYITNADSNASRSPTWNPKVSLRSFLDVFPRGWIIPHMYIRHGERLPGSQKKSGESCGSQELCGSIWCCYSLCLIVSIRPVFLRSRRSLYIAWYNAQRQETLWERGKPLLSS